MKCPQAGWGIIVALLMPVFCIAAPPSPQALPPPMMWKIEGAKPSYLIGTIHAPDPVVATIKPEVAAVIESCDELYTEIALDAESAAGSANAMMLPEGESLRAILPAAIVTRLKAVLAELQPELPFDAFDRMNFFGIINTLGEPAPDEDMNRGCRPLDHNLYVKAETLGKLTGGLETSAERADGFNVVPRRQLIEALDELLKSIEKKAGQPDKQITIKDMVRIYRSGDIEAIRRVTEDELKTGNLVVNRLFNKLVIDDRNERFVKRIIEHLKESPNAVMVFAVGAAHMPGETGVLTQLAKAGYKVTRMPPTGGYRLTPLR